MPDNTIRTQELLAQEGLENISQKLHNAINIDLSGNPKSARKWIWELLQNAKDVISFKGRIEISIDENSVVFSHNGSPFQHSQLLALLSQSKTRKRFKIPVGLEDIFSKPYSAPTEELVRKEIEILMEEYKKFDLSEYIDLYEGKTHALFKYDYSFDRYLKPELKKFCKDWSFKFNYANTALKRILELKAESEFSVFN